LLVRTETPDSYLSVRIIRDLRDRLCELALARDHTYSQEVRRALRFYLAHEENEPATLVGAGGRDLT
jgi:predicted transcriptional regulator